MKDNEKTTTSKDPVPVPLAKLGERKPSLIVNRILNQHRVPTAKFQSAV